MANPAHLRILDAGATAWNAWRRSHARAPRKVLPDLRGAQLRRRSLRRYDLAHADLRAADLRQANLTYALMQDARLDGADLAAAQAKFAVLSRARLADANLRGADLRGASFRRADLTRADLRGSILRHASLVESTIAGARLGGAEVYGAAVWRTRGRPADQRNLVIRPDFDEPGITVDDLGTAQLMFLLLENERIADVIDAASSRVVLLLGRFTPRRRYVLERVRAHLVERNFVPVIFDFARPRGRDLTETVASLANMSCFVLADLTDARSVPQELSHIVPYLPSVPVVPLLGGGRAYAMFEHFRRYPWVLPPIVYRSAKQLLAKLDRSALPAAYREALRARGVRGAALPAPARRGAPSRGRERERPRA